MADGDIHITVNHDTGERTLRVEATATTETTPFEQILQACEFSKVAECPTVFKVHVDPKTGAAYLPAEEP